MHSRIFQLSNEPISKEDYIGEDFFFEDSFIGLVADYVDGDTNREEDIQWFIDSLSSYSDYFEYDKDEQSIIFKDGFSKKYFSKRLEKLKELVNNMTINEFCNNSMEVYTIENLVENKFGFYVVDHNYVIRSLDDFIRNLTPNEKYYFGATIDYHF